ncbi:MAG: hypothetical protein ABIG42_03225 [bacterium]
MSLYVLCGLGVAVYISKDGEFRPIDTSGYMVASIFIWPFALPAWLVSRPPSQLKDLGFEKSTAHYKQWSKTHKTRDIGDFSHWDKKGSKEDADNNGDISGKTSPDTPYVIGGGNLSNDRKQNNNYSDDFSYSTLIENDVSVPRKSYNPFENGEPGSQSFKKELKFRPVKTEKKTRTNTDVPSIADILEDNQILAKKTAKSGKPFSDHNVRKLIDEGRLRDAFRVAHRMLKVSQELGEENRSKAYTRYINEIENRLKAEQEEQDK